VVFVTGDCEYRSEITMPAIASILESRHGFHVTVCYAKNPATGARDPKYRQSIEGLEALAGADLAIFFIRYRELPDDQLRQILEYIHSGRPVVGLRTSTHAFAYAGGANALWNDQFGVTVFGQKWISHHGHDSSTVAAIVDPGSAVVRGVASSIPCASWLYHVKPLPDDCRPLLEGTAVHADGKPFGEKNPVAWTRERGRSRVFYTSLGHPSDFDNESFRKLLINGIYWALGKEAQIPVDGCDARWTGPWTAPPTW
jgi:type 1 glutamine amidotransferase